MGSADFPNTLWLSLSDFCGFPYKPDQGLGKQKRIAKRENSSAKSHLSSRAPRGRSSWVCVPGCQTLAQAGAQLCVAVLLMTFKLMSLPRPSKYMDVGKLAASGVCTPATWVPCVLSQPVPLRRVPWLCWNVTDQPCHKSSGIGVNLLSSVGSGTLVFLNNGQTLPSRIEGVFLIPSLLRDGVMRRNRNDLWGLCSPMSFHEAFECHEFHTNDYK